MHTTIKIRRTCLHLLFPLLAILPFLSLSSQSCRDASVELSAQVQHIPPLITLNWVPNDSATRHFVYRKLKNGSSWGAVVGNLPGSATQFIDTTVNVGVSYEYKVFRQANAFTGNGYINSGIDIAAVESRGIIILVVDSTLIDTLSFEIRRLVDDFTGDGWKVRQIEVSRQMAVTEVKSHIVSAYNSSPASTKAVFLLGRIPVPYSGEINVDGHSDHTGAYPADVYYADVNGTWTDAVVNNPFASDPRNHNIPGDGKFDQGIIASDLELQIGRVDFFNMPAFAKSEIELLRDYLNKDHAYRHKDFKVRYNALIADNFGYFGGEAFASSGWKNAGPLVGPENVNAGGYFPAMSSESYLWSYGCGPGSYTSAGGIGSTPDFAASDLQCVFTMLFGSYFGDWDTQNNFLRAPLAQGKTLTNVWSGRPHWEFHHMGLGENIGYDVRLSQNNSSLYSSNFGGRMVHMAFMGDPTLRNDVLAPPSKLEVSKDGYHAVLSWNSSPDLILGYHVYVKPDYANDYLRVNTAIITDTFFTDSCLFLQGLYSYMVRAVKLERSPSGTYYNLSQGIMNEVLHVGDPSIIADFDYLTEDNLVTFTNTTNNATSYLWDFEDGTFSIEENPVHIFSPGHYDVKLTALNECDVDSVFIGITIFGTATYETSDGSGIFIYPNPSDGYFHISSKDDFKGTLQIYSVTGNVVFENLDFNSGDAVDVRHLPKGMYFVIIAKGDKKYFTRIVIE